MVWLDMLCKFTYLLLLSITSFCYWFTGSELLYFTQPPHTEFIYVKQRMRLLFL